MREGSERASRARLSHDVHLLPLSPSEFRAVGGHSHQPHSPACWLGDPHSHSPVAPRAAWTAPVSPGGCSHVKSSAAADGPRPRSAELSRCTWRPSASGLPVSPGQLTGGHLGFQSRRCGQSPSRLRSLLRGVDGAARRAGHGLRVVEARPSLVQQVIPRRCPAAAGGLHPGKLITLPSDPFLE